MENKECPERSWIVLDKAVLLSKVNGVIFAPEGFKEHQKSLSTSTGVVPLSKLAPLFPNINSDMITQFLCHLEFCQEIKELKLASLLVAELQQLVSSTFSFQVLYILTHLEMSLSLVPQSLTTTVGGCSSVQNPSSSSVVDFFRFFSFDWLFYLLLLQPIPPLVIV